jgi:hypothetical protein
LTAQRVTGRVQGMYFGPDIAAPFCIKVRQRFFRQEHGLKTIPRDAVRA